LDSPLDPQPKGSFAYLAAATLAAALGGLLFGFDTAVISGTEDFVKVQFSLDDVAEGWFVSSAIFGCILGVLGAGKLSDAFGRKKVLFLSAALFFISAVGCAAAPWYTLLVGFRLVGGLGIGVASMLAPMYISEITPAHLRGRLVAFYQFAISLGLVVAYVSNKILLVRHQAPTGSPGTGLYHWMVVKDVWRSMLGVGALPALFFGLLAALVPESPRWLVKQGKTDRAFDILTRVCGREAATRELAAIREALSVETGRLRQLLQPGWRIALVIGLALPFLSQVCGINAIIYYGPKILSQAGFGLDEAFGAQVAIGLVNVAITVAAMLTVDRLGRRPLLIFGVAGCVASLLVIGGLFFAGITQGPWLLTFILLYIACFAFSFGPVCWIIMAEMFPTSIRGRAMSLATLSLWVGCWLVSQMFPWLLRNAGPAWTFWLFAILCFPAIPLTIWLIPETKGKSLEEIEKHWMRKGQAKQA
jgi:SP family arabinose:H+ symporter-like MFS transporter